MKRNKKAFLVSMIMVVLMTQACNLDKTEKEVIIQVNDEFAINMLEILGSSRQFALELTSVELEPCLNSSIDRTLFASNNKVTLVLNGVVPAIDCNPGIAPAYSVGNAGILDEGIYDVLISIRNTINNEGMLIVREDKYEINMLSVDGVVIENGELFRIPEKTIWGYYAYDNASLVGSAPESFMADLQDISSPLNLKDGYYGHFEIMNNNELRLKSLPEKKFFGTFYYEFDGNDGELTTILENHRNGPAANHLELTIFTAAGKTL